jgi:hypothetical protein
MKLPVDTSAIAFLCAVEAEPVVDFETKRPRADENGEPLYLVQLIAMTDGAAEILAVKVPGMPSGLRQGHPVKVSGLVAQPWTMNDRSGVVGRSADCRDAGLRLPRHLDQHGCSSRTTVRGNQARLRLPSKAG